MGGAGGGGCIRCYGDGDGDEWWSMISNIRCCWAFDDGSNDGSRCIQQN